MMSPRIKSPEKSLHPHMHMGDGNRIVRRRCGGAYLNTTRNCFVRFEFNFGYYLHLSKYVKHLHRITTDIYIPMTETKWA